MGQDAGKEVAVEDELNDTAGDGELVVMASLIVAIEPVADVQALVDAQRQYVVEHVLVDVFRLGDEVELGQHYHCFEVDAERPENLQGCEFVVDE